MSSAVATISRAPYIIVDLDGTLVLTDTFAASVLEAVRRRPLSFIAVMAALLRGRATCKRVAALLARLNIGSLPYNEPLVDYLRQQRRLGRRLILATGADQSIASAVAGHLGIFDEVIASSEGRNVIGDEKLRAIRAMIGDLPFTYAGNSRSDLKIWRRSHSAILVGARRSYARELRGAGIVVQQEFEGAHFNLKALVRCLRLHQWSKNLLVFVPIVLAHKIWNALAMRQGLLAFLAFSFCASTFYIVNDLLDLQADRAHPRKCRRPLASGELSVQAGLGLGAFMAVATAAMGAFLHFQALVLLAGYALTSLSYSLKLKRMLFLDVVSLALLYAARVLYGGSATGIKISVWTLAFSLFLFASLATIKRLAELRRVNVSAAGVQEYRGYRDVDINQLASLASAGGYVAVLVLALYINSPEIQLLYRRPQGLWLLCPVLIYWIGRASLIANRGDLDDDPVAFALRDRATWIVGGMAAIILLLST